MMDEKDKQALFEAILARDTAERFGRAAPQIDENGYLVAPPKVAPEPQSLGMTALETFGSLIPNEILIVFVVIAAIVALIVDLIEF